ncbi:MAG TPA: tyrosine--tRNA ligase [Bacteroidia bacterium]|nr:tyrosine--tRNA ligase [Bacteroidia bacterium]HNT79437.1 tyrosine--tRNA ligase [Bacteroidia bacterium]
MDFIEELKWRGMLQDIIPGTEDHLRSGSVSGYIGFDPTADSLGVGNLVQVMTLTHFQRAGHKPIALVGGATGMVGDPSGKSAERNLLDSDSIEHNVQCQKKQLEKFLDFDTSSNAAVIVNNYDWFKDYSFLGFIREIGKHISVNYMMAKDSVKNRLETGMSFTEFSYQLIQGYDFMHLYQHHNCKLQMGGSDQWGNIVTGTELIRRKLNGEAYACTTPLIKKADGTKFGKTEGGNIWLDPNRTSPYHFYQFWINSSDEDVKTFIRIFSLKGQEEIEALEQQHIQAPEQRLLQKTLADELTARVHSEEDLSNAKEASDILFGKGTAESLRKIPESVLLSVFEGVPMFSISKSHLNEGIGVIDLLAAESQVFPSKGEARKMIQGGGVSINKEKIADYQMTVKDDLLINNKYLLIQRGKKNYYLLICE